MDTLFNTDKFTKKFTHKELIPIAYKWVLANRSCGVAFKELNTIGNEYPDVIGFGSWGHSVLIEVKVSRTDFLCDKKKSFRINPEKGMGKYRFYCCPTGLIKVSELPDGWGLVYVNEKGKAICEHDPYKRKIGPDRTIIWGHQGFSQNLQDENNLMYSALRRLHIKGHIDCIYDKDYNYNHKEI